MKRIFDLIISLFGLITFSPIIILLTVGLFFANKGNPFYLQIRPGKNEKLFSIIKFKTMNNEKNSDGTLKSDADRLTYLGRIIRKTSLDEIPQLINVLIGDMSIIGPRPLLPEYLPLYNKAQKKRHNIRPGITGWAQINGRNAISWGKKFELDVWYVENQSMFLDLKILLLTIKKVIISDGISQKNQATVEPFKGNDL
jgi:lipopolysaccharide/colanic/teichoic acid biosynthesis glycosyltransferase